MASTSTFDAATGVFEGTCAIVGFLNAPGFAKIVGSRQYADITGEDSISLRVKSSTPGYAGFTVTDSTDWQVVEVPLTQFSYDWSGYTGECNTKDPASFGSEGQQHYCCDKSGLEPSNSEVCVQPQFLNTINALEVWAEGVEGDFNLQIDSIS